MARSDNRGYRPWLKLRLKDSADALHAIEIVTYWQHTKEAAHHVTRAIRMYYALLLGDTTLLKQYFPMLADAISRGNGAPSIWQQPVAPAKVETAVKSEEEDKADLLDGLF